MACGGSCCGKGGGVGKENDLPLASTTINGKTTTSGGTNSNASSAALSAPTKIDTKRPSVEEGDDDASTRIVSENPSRSCCPEENADSESRGKRNEGSLASAPCKCNTDCLDRVALRECKDEVDSIMTDEIEYLVDNGTCDEKKE